MKAIISFLSLSILVLFSHAQVPNAFDYVSNKETISNKGAVVSAHALASEAGLTMLKKGGNAIDAAIATQFALAVVLPVAGNIGGGGFMVAHLSNGKNIALDFRETAPAAASRDMYLDANGNPQLELSQNGRLSAGVPGSVAGMFAALKYAKLGMATLIAPAIQLAKYGFVISEDQANSFNYMKESFIKYNNHKVAFVKESKWKAGDTLVQKDLARTLERIRDLGKDGFYKGITASLIAKEMNSNNGIISLKDLDSYKVKERVVTQFNYKGHQIISMPLPSSGGIILQQLFGMIEGRNIDSMGFQSPAATQLMIEAERRAFADRAFYQGDPDFVKVPVQQLVSNSYLKNRMSDFKYGVAGNSVMTKEGMVDESKETTHLSVLDNMGNAVSITTTLNGSYGSKTVVNGAGFLLNNEMDDFSVKPGVPNMYGAVGNEKNAIAPGKRMLSSMTPTIVLKDDRPFMVVGTPGGTTIPTSVFQSIVNVIDFNMEANAAVNYPKFHHQWLPDRVQLEKGFNNATRKTLQEYGYKVVEVDAIGRTEMILIKYLPNGKKIINAVADRRGDDAVAAY